MYAKSNQYNNESNSKNEITSELENSITLEDMSIISIVNDIISSAVRKGASDIHIEPTEEDLKIRFRIDGMLQEYLGLPKEKILPLVSRIKLIGQMDIAERRLPQDGRVQIEVEENKIDLRISSLPTIFGEKLLVRILDKRQDLLHISKLGFSKIQLERFKEIINYPYGLILVTGPTGSGKTTTLYAALNYIGSIHKNIITIEDPVEYVLKGINQVQCNLKAGLDFSKGLRSIVRQDPDIIMIGEIRDQETAKISVRSSSTGHLVFSTLHTNNATSALNRLVNMGVESFLVASSVMAVISQRLVRKVCPSCKESYIPEKTSPEFIFLSKKHTKHEIKLAYATGCSACNYTGFKGRIAIQEVFKVSANERKLLLNGADDETIKKSALNNGLITMEQDGITKALEGITTLSEVIRIT
ncbi:type IV pilus assembly protein PilB [Desulfonispora thiosulfatigenes DSM 11270]|uniref:Type IV pilus assembly protein PilB n=1 Tax=Desulfonispora thiosulfatigenes DSM 11270 TaxID=656914 RepID=A0A1W1VMT0_DESTI|nr:GspE/PulE family protein [Desulfonispora thiosulfatigenes]SMB94695.1 type IV pilus assembly protein PilB [Desulfonispora thiosulfatigenes DSM 11270]